MKKYRKISLLTLLILFLFNTVFASWFVVNTSNIFKNAEIGKKTNSEPVAYTYVDNVKTQYMTI